MKTKTIARQAFLAMTLFLVTNYHNSTYAQNIGINSTGVSPDASAGLDVDFSNKGVLIPRVALTATNVAGPIASPAVSLLVYNTATAGTAPNNVVPGYYYWETSQWKKLSSDGEGWKITGNSNIGAANFLGTTNNFGINFRTNNVERMRVLSTGQVAVNSTATFGTSTFYSEATGNNNAIDGNSASTGATIYGQNSGVGEGVQGLSTNGNGVGVYGVNISTLSSTGIVGIGNASSTFSSGLNGTGVAGTAAGNGYGVMGTHFNGVNGERFGVLGSPVNGVSGQFSPSKYGWIGSNTEGLYAQNSTTLYGLVAAASGSQSYGLYGSASGNTFNAGLLVSAGETVISNSNAIGASTGGMTRSWNGSIFTKAASSLTTGGRIWYLSGSYLFYVNSSGSADYSEYFKTNDQTLGVGEVVAMDPENANGVRRARPNDVSKTVGIVSIGGTRYNDNLKGDRQDDPNYVNVGLLGQVPVLITTENGDIKPGDPLTVSKIYRGRVTKATDPCRIIGYAATNFPYVSDEQDYEIDINGTDKLRLNANHVMCYLNPGWYEPADASLTDGIEPPSVESAYDMLQRINVELPLENPNKEFFETNDANSKSLQKSNSIEVKETQRVNKEKTLEGK